jgi:hypothetical protein
MGTDQADTMQWLKALLHPLVGTLFTPATAPQASAKPSENKSPHRRNSLNPTELAAALSEDEVSSPQLVRTASSKSNSKTSGAVDDGEDGTIVQSSSYNGDESLVEPASKLDRVLSQADSALQEAALLAEGWRYSEEDAVRLSEVVEHNVGDENLRTVDA